VIEPESALLAELLADDELDDPDDDFEWFEWSDGRPRETIQPVGGVL